VHSDALNPREPASGHSADAGTASTPGANPVVTMHGIVKTYGSLRANDGVDFDLRPSEIHCLLGENGAGKTTLMKILFGLVSPDAGEIEVQGQRVKISSPAVALSHGIGMVHQHFMLLPNFTVAENVVLGSESNFDLRFRADVVEARVQETANRFGIGIDPSARVGELSVDAQQRIEILKLLYRGAGVLILDEPTSSIGPKQIERLFATLDELRHQGRSVVLITHRLSEVVDIADRVTVLRLGRVVRVAARGNFGERDLARAMVGADLPPRPPRKPVPPDAETLLRVRALEVVREDGNAALAEVDFAVRRGEVFGIVGVEGNGQRELAEALSGLRSPSSGEIEVASEDASRASPRELHARGVSTITEDRLRYDLIADMTLAENLALSDVAGGRISSGGFLNRRRIRANAVRLLAEYGVSPASPDAKAAALSGGNQQKVVLARELSRNPKLLIASQPTRGLDVGATNFVHGQFRKLREQGCAIVLITLDLDELMALADRVGVLFKGKLIYVDDAIDVSMEKLASAMAGFEPVAA